MSSRKRHVGNRVSRVCGLRLPSVGWRSMILMLLFAVIVGAEEIAEEAVATVAPHTRVENVMLETG